MTDRITREMYDNAEVFPYEYIEQLEKDVERLRLLLSHLVDFVEGRVYRVDLSLACTAVQETKTRV